MQSKCLFLCDGHTNLSLISLSYIRIKEQINYEIMTILQNEGVELAYNTQTVYVKK